MPQAAPTSAPAALQQAKPRPIVRAQAADEPPPAPQAPVPSRVILTLPPPEQLGITSSAAADTDWTATHRKLEQLGVTCFQLDRQSGGCRVTCLMPTGQPGRNRRIEVQAATVAEAVRLLLEQTEQWAKKQI